ncbi:MAG TPA: hypothetical protein VMU43_12230 [Candidatus Acidoferrum sp.]|nr:hypothetical protein [Candidatus Acidoferrum sp.]
MPKRGRRKAEGGEAEYIRQTGTAKGAEVEAVGLARAKGFQAQVEALGQSATAIVNVIAALAEGKAKFVPDILVTSGGNGGALEGLAATAMRFFNNGGAHNGTAAKKEEKKEASSADAGAQSQAAITPTAPVIPPGSRTV